MTILLRILTALFPLALAPVLLFAIADGSLDFGGGEKDLFVLLPWLLWSLIFAASAFFLWWRRCPVGRALARSALIGLAGLAFAGAVLAAFVSLGLGGRY